MRGGRMSHNCGSGCKRKAGDRCETCHRPESVYPGACGGPKKRSILPQGIKSSLPT